MMAGTAETMVVEVTDVEAMVVEVTNFMVH